MLCMILNCVLNFLKSEFKNNLYIEIYLENIFLNSYSRKLFMKFIHKIVF